MVVRALDWGVRKAKARARGRMDYREPRTREGDGQGSDPALQSIQLWVEHRGHWIHVLRRFQQESGKYWGQAGRVLQAPGLTITKNPHPLNELGFPNVGLWTSFTST